MAWLDNDISGYLPNALSNGNARMSLMSFSFHEVFMSVLMIKRTISKPYKNTFSTI